MSSTILSDYVSLYCLHVPHYFLSQSIFKQLECSMFPFQVFCMSLKASANMFQINEQWNATLYRHLTFAHANWGCSGIRQDSEKGKNFICGLKLVCYHSLYKPWGTTVSTKCPKRVEFGDFLKPVVCLTIFSLPKVITEFQDRVHQKDKRQLSVYANDLLGKL